MPGIGQQELAASGQRRSCSAAPAATLVTRSMAHESPGCFVCNLSVKSLCATLVNMQTSTASRSWTVRVAVARVVLSTQQRSQTLLQSLSEFKLQRTIDLLRTLYAVIVVVRVVTVQSVLLFPYSHTATAAS
jgi:hypothetical protein